MSGLRCPVIVILRSYEASFDKMDSDAEDF